MHTRLATTPHTLPFDAQVPRQTSYPRPAVCTSRCEADNRQRSLGKLDPQTPMSVDLKIPFCEWLCRVCACHTQGPQTLGPVQSAIETLEAKLEIARNTMPAGLRMILLHFGGRTPSILPPALPNGLPRAIFDVFTPTEVSGFSLEHDPMMRDRAKVGSLAAYGMNQASIGSRGRNPEPQPAIGRKKPPLGRHRV